MNLPFVILQCLLPIYIVAEKSSRTENVEKQWQPKPLKPNLFSHKNYNQEKLSGPVVNLRSAQIRGLSAEDGDYSMFMGVPFGAINSSNPFGVAHLVELEGDVDATREGPECPQVNRFSVLLGSINCLHLNIYVPNPVNPSSNRTVMMYLFGGGFQSGSNSIFELGPKFLIEQDVILVMINYRVGPYGFLNLNTPEVPGNQGLKDQLLAMRWVKKNIEYFGGNPEGMTLFGQSAGAASTDYHIFTDHELLFDKVILQSATSLTEIVAPTKANVDAAFIMTEHLGYNASDVHDVLYFLASMPELAVIQAGIELNFKFIPTLEQEFDGVEHFIRNHTVFLNSSKIKDISVMIGYTDAESDYLYTDINTIPDTVFKNIVQDNFKLNGNHLEKMGRLIRKFYMGEKTFIDGEYLYNENILFKISDCDSDLTFYKAGQRSIELYEENNVKVIYEYLFKYSGERNYISKALNRNNNRVVHGDELGYLFDSLLDTTEISPEDRLVIDRMVTLWVNFAKYGDPTPTVSELLPVKWEPRTQSKSYYYVIDSELSLDTSIFNNRMAFWDLFYKHNKKYQTGFSLFSNE